MRLGRHCDPEKYSVPNRQNGPKENDPEEYLVYGHFDQRNERDTKGHDTMVWLTLEQLNTAVEEVEEGEEDLDRALAAWETESKRRRVERLRALRSGA